MSTALVDDEFVIDTLLKQADWSYYRKLAGTVETAPAFIDTPADDAASALYISDTTSRWRHSQWLSDARRDHAGALAFDMFNAGNDLYCR